MEIQLKWYDSIEKRTSRRSYIDKEIGENDLNKIYFLIDSINKEYNLNIQFVKDGKKAFKGLGKTYGMLNGVKSFIALVGNKNIPNIESKMGYLGEALVLECTSLELGTCWVGGTYDKNYAEKSIDIKDNEKLYCVITVGHVKDEKGLREKMLSSIGKKRKSFEENLIAYNTSYPNWVECGINSVIKAPSALNKQPWQYEYKDGFIKAKAINLKHGYEKIDLGISMLHFQLGALKCGYDGKWQHTNGINIFR